MHYNMKEIDWANLAFGYMKTDYNVRINFRNGAWGELEGGISCLYDVCVT